MGGELLDIVGHLPVEIGENILSYLGGQDLCRCSLVSKKWCQLSSRPFLWKKVCEIEHPEELRYIGDSQDQDANVYKECYKRAVKGIKNWMTNNYWWMETPEIATTFYPGNGGVLAVIRTDSSIALYDLNQRREKARLIQRLEPFSSIPVERSQLKVFTTDKLINIVRHQFGERREDLGSTVHTFEWESDKLYRKEIFHKEDPTSSRDLEPLLKDGRFPPHVILLGMIGSSFLFYNELEDTDYFCDGNKIKAKLKRPAKSMDCHIYNDTYFLRSSKIVGYGPSGEEKMCLDFEDIKPKNFYAVTLKCNKDIILIEVISRKRKAVGWLWENTKMRLPTILESRNTFFVHPIGRNVSYFNQKNCFDDCEIITKALDTGDIISVVPFRLDFGTYTSFFSGNFTLIYKRFGLLVPTLSHPLAGDGEFLLMDLKSGTTLFQEPFNHFMITFANNKVLESYYDKGTESFYRLRVFT